MAPPSDLEASGGEPSEGADRGAGLLTYILRQLDELRASSSADSLLDTSRKVEDLMELFGWDVRSPRQVSRSMQGGDGPVVITFRTEHEARLKIAVWPYRRGFGHAAVSFFSSEEGVWRAATNGELWQILPPVAAGGPEHAIDIRKPDAEVHLRRLLSHETHLTRVVDHESPEALPAVGRGAATKPTASDVTWPSRATHAMKRKGCVGFIEYDLGTGRTTLLAGSLLRAKMGSSFSRHHRATRERAIASSLLVREGAFLRLAGDLILPSPSAAASQVAGTMANGWLLWLDRLGRPIERAASDLSPGGPERTPGARGGT